MIKGRIRVKNYRCFGHEPQEIELGTGFMSFIGLNNSGKSATLKMFYELRPLWEHFSDRGNLNFLIKGRSERIGTLGLRDSAEISNHFTNAPIELWFELPGLEKEKIEFGFRITPNPGSSQINFISLGYKINSHEVEFINSSSHSGESYKILCNETMPDNSRKQSFKEVGFISNFFNELKNSIYIPAFRNVINIGENSHHYDIATGTAFIKQWDEWKSGSNKFHKQQIIKITDDIRNLFSYKSLEILASTEKHTLWLNIDGNPHSILEVGAGLSQFILSFATAAIKKPTYIFIDEPELNLHPALQLKFLTSFAAYASIGVVFSTHSLGLARSAEKVFSVISNGKETKIKPFTNTPDYSTLLGELSFSSYKEIGADCIFFVEGVTEIRTIQELLRKFGKDNKVLPISLGGSDLINGKREAEIAEITTRVDVKKVYAWIDSEKDSSVAELKSDRKQFVEVCKRLKITCGVSERRAIENYFTEQAIRTAFSDGTKTALSAYEKFDPSLNWSKSENWKIAREMSLDEIKNTDLGKFIENIE